jgi:RimJ/RimL family protein N-acetyltransferase
LLLRDLKKDDLATLRSWFSDPELDRRLSYPTDEWWHYVQTESRASVHIAADAQDNVLGEIQVDRGPENVGQFAFFVCPSLRGQGLGKQMLKLFIEGPGSTYASLLASVEPDNHASLAVLSALGFESSGSLDEDGMLSLYHRAVIDASPEMGW